MQFTVLRGTSTDGWFLSNPHVGDRMEAYLLGIFRFTALLFAVFVAFGSRSTFADTFNLVELSKLFPETVGIFRKTQPPLSPDVLTEQGILSSPEVVVGGQAEYVGGHNERFLVEIVRLRQESGAYSMLSIAAASARANQPQLELTSNYGTASFATDEQITFFKGSEFVRITNLSKSKSSNVVDLARALADTIDKGEADIPALVKHLPNPEQARKTALFIDRFTSLQTLLPNQAVLASMQTDRDADAAFVDTGSGKVLVVEYHTPQLAKDNDDRIIAKIHELWNLGQLAPTGYRRVGNYSVFVFDAADEATAKQFIDQVKYEQVVQWLGDNPNILKEAERRYVQTTLGVFIAVMKASGFAVVTCLGLGGLIGALLFSRRRSRQTALEAYSDAGGMLRLNIDEMTPQTDPARLLGPGQKA